jgi:type VI protein secretion system component VasA
LPTRSPFTSNQSLPLGVDVEPLAVQHSEPVVQQHGRLRLGVTPVINSFERARGTIGIDVVVQQYALH